MASVLVLGAGAVGSVFGARLAAAGVPVVLIGRPAHVEAIRTRGLAVEGVSPGTVRVDALAEVPRGGTPTAVLVTVKAFDLSSALERLARAVGPTPTALLENGLGIETVGVSALRAGGWERPERWVARGIHTVPATLLAPGRVRASGVGEVVFPAPGSPLGPAPVVERFVALLRRAGFSVRTSTSFARELWRKAAVNAAINPVTALRGVVNGALAAGPAREEAERLLAEAVAVAQRTGVDLSLETALDDLDRVVRATAENRSSMLQDVERGRPTELDAISGEILRQGTLLGLSLPATAGAIDRVRARLAASRPPAQPS